MIHRFNLADVGASYCRSGEEEKQVSCHRNCAPCTFPRRAGTRWLDCHRICMPPV